jgi:pyruvate ferredoxin oxidoreductase delta subunit
MIIINSTKSREELAVPPQAGDVAIVDATGISEDLFGRNIPNTAMLGAFVKATGLVDKDPLFRAIGERFGEANIAAAERAYEEAVIVPAGPKEDAAEECAAAEAGAKEEAEESAYDPSRREHITPKGDTGMYVLDTASWRVFRPVMDKEKCIECGLCMAYCPVDSVISDGACYTITYDFCKGCGLCAKECPKGAISMQPEADYAGGEE